MVVVKNTTEKCIQVLTLWVGCASMMMCPSKDKHRKTRRGKIREFGEVVGCF